MSRRSAAVLDPDQFTDPAVHLMDAACLMSEWDSMGLLYLDALRNAAVTTDPFTFTVVPGFVQPEQAAAIRKDFPDIAYPGLLPVEATRHGPRFAALIRELQSREVAAAFSDKFGIDLVGRATMITVRGRCAGRDGRIHTDSECKVVTALLYFNDTWEAAGGRLRLLRGPDDLKDMIAEVPPEVGHADRLPQIGQVVPRA